MLVSVPLAIGSARLSLTFHIQTFQMFLKSFCKSFNTHPSAFFVRHLLRWHAFRTRRSLCSAQILRGVLCLPCSCLLQLPSLCNACQEIRLLSIRACCKQSTCPC